MQPFERDGTHLGLTDGADLVATGHSWSELLTAVQSRDAVQRPFGLSFWFDQNGMLVWVGGRRAARISRHSTFSSSLLSASSLLLSSLELSDTRVYEP